MRHDEVDFILAEIELVFPKVTQLELTVVVVVKVILDMTEAGVETASRAIVNVRQWPDVRRNDRAVIDSDIEQVRGNATL